MRNGTVEMGGEERMIVELRPRANAEWREKFEPHFDGLQLLIQQATVPDLMEGDSLTELTKTVKAAIRGSLETITALVKEYAPDLPYDEAYESEIVEAFGIILGLAYPFGSLVEKLRRLAAG